MKLALALLIVCPAFAEIPVAVRGHIDDVIGSRGFYVESDDVHRVHFPRQDVNFTVQGWPAHAFLGLLSWAAFSPDPAGKSTVMRGQLLVLEGEAQAVLDEVLAAGFTVSALHDHLTGESPRALFLHVSGWGEGPNLAKRFRRCLDRMRGGSAAGSPAVASEAAKTSAVPAGPLDAIFGLKGQSYAGMYRVAMARRERPDGLESRPSMGVGSWIAFSGTADKALAIGHVAVETTEIPAVLKELRSGGIAVNGIDSVAGAWFVHFQAVGRPQTIAQRAKRVFDRLGAK